MKRAGMETSAVDPRGFRGVVPDEGGGLARNHLAPSNGNGEPLTQRYQTYIVTVPDLAGRLVAKRLDADFYLSAAERGFGVCDVVFGWGLGHEEWDGFATIGWDKGYGDLVATPDPSSHRRLAWWPNTALLMADARRPDGELVAVAPRQILRSQVERAAQLGLSPVIASELEFTVFDESLRSMAQKGYTGLQPHGERLQPELLESLGYDEPLFAEMRRCLKESGIPVESIKAEYSVGQFELVMSPADALRAADNHAVFKLGVREMCRARELEATFMAKWHDEHAGSSCHLHISLEDQDNRNVFAEGDDVQLRHFMAGVLRYGAEMFILWAPFANSYKRLQPGTFAPANFTWGTDNRTTALRICGTGGSRHLENRVPGGDVNPYLAYAAYLACGLRGIEERLEPGEMTLGNAYDSDQAPVIPRTVEQALERFGASTFARDCFGSEVVDHLVNFFSKENDASRTAVTDWDRRRLFDI